MGLGFGQLATPSLSLPPTHITSQTHHISHHVSHAADLPGTLFDNDVDSWNPQNLGDLLQQFDAEIPGVTKPYLCKGPCLGALRHRLNIVGFKLTDCALFPMYHTLLFAMLVQTLACTAPCLPGIPKTWISFPSITCTLASPRPGTPSLPPRTSGRRLFLWRFFFFYDAAGCRGCP